MQILIEEDVLKALLALMDGQMMTLETAKAVVAASNAMDKGNIVEKCWKCNCTMVHIRAPCNRTGRTVKICIHCAEETAL